MVLAIIMAPVGQPSGVRGADTVNAHMGKMQQNGCKTKKKDETHRRLIGTIVPKVEDPNVHATNKL